MAETRDRRVRSDEKREWMPGKAREEGLGGEGRERRERTERFGTWEDGRWAQARE